MVSEQQPEARDAAGGLQEIVLQLIGFWTDQGCLLLPSCDFEIEAGTLHPDNFFHLIDPDPWRAVHLQPVRRPLDGRRREHPFRLLKHLQLQVVLEPPPADVQDLYLRSLEAVGLELRDHDLRFAEWRWESAALDAWGSGWHVLVDGLGITRLTFLQQAAGRDLDPPTVELSYGIERLSMLRTGAPAASEIRWRGEGPTYGQLRRSDEADQSRYMFEVADVDALRQQLEASLAESQRCLEAGLPRVAYELAVKSLQNLDVLEARDALPTLERERWLQEVRDRVTDAAELHLRAKDERDSTPPSEDGAGTDADSETPSDDEGDETTPSTGTEKRARKPTGKTRKPSGKTRRAAGKTRRRKKKPEEPADGG